MPYITAPCPRCRAAGTTLVCCVDYASGQRRSVLAGRPYIASRIRPDPREVRVPRMAWNGTDKLNQIIEAVRTHYRLCAEFNGVAAADLYRTFEPDLVTGHLTSQTLLNSGLIARWAGQDTLGKVVSLVSDVYTDFRMLVDEIGHEGAGDCLVGWLWGQDGIHQMCVALRHFISDGNGRSVHLGTMHREWARVHRARSRYSATLLAANRGYVDRTKAHVAEAPTLCDITHWVQAATESGTPVDMAEAIGWQACAEMGYHITCDFATRSLLEAFRPDGDCRGNTSATVRGRMWGNRHLRLRLFPLLDVSNGKVRVCQTGDVTITDLAVSNEGGIYPVSARETAKQRCTTPGALVQMSWHPAVYQDRVTRQEMHNIELLMKGRDLTCARLYTRLKSNAVACRLPEGLENGEALTDAYDSWREKSLVSAPIILAMNLNVRAVVSFYAASKGYLDFCHRVGERILALYRLDRLEIIAGNVRLGRMVSDATTGEIRYVGSSALDAIDSDWTLSQIHILLRANGIPLSDRLPGMGHIDNLVAKQLSEWPFSLHMAYKDECVEVLSPGRVGEPTGVD